MATNLDVYAFAAHRLSNGEIHISCYGFVGKESGLVHSHVQRAFTVSHGALSCLITAKEPASAIRPAAKESDSKTVLKESNRTYCC